MAKAAVLATVTVGPEAVASDVATEAGAALPAGTGDGTAAGTETGVEIAGEGMTAETAGVEKNVRCLLTQINFEHLLKVPAG